MSDRERNTGRRRRISRKEDMKFNFKTSLRKEGFEQNTTKLKI